MTRMNLPKDTWIEAFTSVTAQTFYLSNYPDRAVARAYKIHYGASTPPDDTDIFVYHNMRSQNEMLVVVNNLATTNVYIMALYDDGAIIY